MTENTTILIVDDMEINRVILKELFQEECTILEAENGQIALDLLAEHPETDVVILDIVMPVMDGFEALSHIRENPALAGLPVVICTEHSDVDTQVRALDLGSSDFITKPFNARVVRHRIRKMIESRKMERKIAEQQRADQLRGVLNSIVSPLGLIEFAQGKVRTLYMNQSFTEMVSNSEVNLQQYSANILSSILPEDAELLLDLFHQNQENGTSVDIIYRVPKKDGSMDMHEMHAMAIQYEHFENPVYLVSVADITNQRRTEIALRDTDMRLKSLINAIPGAILTIDMEASAKVTYFNDTACGILGMTRAELQAYADDISQVVYEPDRASAAKALAKFAKDRLPYGETFRVMHKDGQLRWLFFSAAPIVTTDGKLLCNCVCIDISAEKESELKLAQAFKEMQYRSEHDSLTDIWNRETFNQKTHEFLLANSDTPYVILTMNIQRFKVINELFGASVGDEVLRTLSRTLERLFGSFGTCGRMEADHFVACFPQSELNMEQIVKTFDAELKMQYSDYRIELFFGIYEVYDHSVAVDQMCDRATMALKTIKGSAVKRFAYYDDAMRKNLLAEQEIIDEMDEALAQGQFVPYFQPIFGIDSLKPVSAEALVRWRHPTKGLIPPGLFVPLFERNGFITKLDFAIWEQTCRFQRQWQDQGLPVVPISVNISRIDLYQPHLCEDILGLLEKYDLDISLLKLEITESACIDDPEVLPAVLKRFREAGFQILMDDFGSGYSSLNTLKDMPINIMKIDMCFLSQMEGSPRAASILTSVVRMAKWLDMPVVAEGVETKAQLDFLHSIGCGMGQGYYFSRPLPSEDFEKLLVVSNDTASLPRSRATGTIDLDLLWNGNTESSLLLNSMIGGMAVFELTNGDLKVQRVNDTYYQVIGCTPQQVFHPSGIALSYLMEEDRVFVLDACVRAIASNQVEIADVRRKQKDGLPCWLEYRIRHLSTSGDSSSFFFVVNDITAQKELELSRSFGQHSHVLSHMFKSICDLNFTQDCFFEIFPASSPTPSCSPAEALNRYLAIVHPEDQALLRQFFTPGFLGESLQSDSPRNGSTIKLRMQSSDGGYAQHFFTFIKLDDLNGDDAYLLCLSDMNAHSEAQENGVNPVDSLYNRIFLSEALYVFDIEPTEPFCNLLYQSDDAAEMFYPYAHYLRMEDGYLHPDDLPNLRAAFSPEHFQQLHQTQNSGYRVQMRIKNLQDQWVWIESTLHLMEAAADTPPHFLLFTKTLDPQKYSEAEWRTRAETDAMSLLYNRGATQERISQLLIDAPGDAHAFFLLDIDDFKHINDSLGHAVGDSVIKAIAKVLKQVFRVTDLAGRLGGDEFATFMSYPQEDSCENVRIKARKTIEAIQGIRLPEHPDLSPSISLGIAVAPTDGTDFETLYQKADQALYYVKERGKNNFALYQDLPDSEKE